jgi:hypothetical protein
MRGASGYFRLGGTPNEHVQFGPQLFWWWRKDGYQEFSRVNVGVTSQLFPFHSNGRRGSVLSEWHTRLGFGIANASNTVSGLGLQFGTGIDLGMDGRFFVTPSVDVLVQLYRHFTNTALLFTMGLTWH